MKKLLDILVQEDGATAVEYAVMLGLIIAACFAGINMVGAATLSSYNNSVSSIDAAFNGGH